MVAPWFAGLNFLSSDSLSQATFQIIVLLSCRLPEWPYTVAKVLLSCFESGRAGVSNVFHLILLCCVCLHAVFRGWTSTQKVDKARRSRRMEETDSVLRVGVSACVPFRRLHSRLSPGAMAQAASPRRVLHHAEWVLPPRSHALPVQSWASAGRQKEKGTIRREGWRHPLSFVWLKKKTGFYCVWPRELISCLWVSLGDIFRWEELGAGSVDCCLAGPCILV